MAAVTQLGLYGGSRMPYGSFAGKAAPVLPETQPAGGWGFANIYDRYREEKREREQEESQARKAIQAIQDETDAEIARLLHKQMAYEARTQEIDKLEFLMRQFDDRQERNLALQFNQDVAAAYDRALKLGTFASAEAFERAMERALEEEEFLFLAIATLQ